MIPGKAEPNQYELQLENKQRFLNNLFQELNLPDIQVFSSPAESFRMRAEFKIWQKDAVASYAMYEPGKYKQPILIDEFSIGSRPIVHLMPKLIQSINDSDILRRKLFQIEFLSSTIGELLVTLIYHKPLDSEWEQLAKRLQDELGCYIIGRSRGQKLVLDKDYIYEQFETNIGTFKYQQVEASFTQPNAAVCLHMLNWALEKSTGLEGDLLELYCGNANFTLPLSRNFEKVLATEISKTSVKSALHNIELNIIENIEIVRLSSEEFTQAINRERPFRRLSHLDLDAYDFSTIFVDPPRAGLDDGTVDLAGQFDNIIYISCNPITLKDNLLEFTKTHEIQSFAMFDQFPYTDHIECGVVLKKRID